MGGVGESWRDEQRDRRTWCGGGCACDLLGRYLGGLGVVKVPELDMSVSCRNKVGGVI